MFVGKAKQCDDVSVDVIDLADTPIPSANFASRIGADGGFVIVTPEYNHGYPGPLKTAIDSVSRQWQAKPVGFVCYGGLSGGLRAVEQLRIVFAELHTVTIRDTVSFHGAHAQFDQRGTPPSPRLSTPRPARSWTNSPGGRTPSGTPERRIPTAPEDAAGYGSSAV